jgi:DsbC/DsbD-like thiol-disulfide interchange protein
MINTRFLLTAVACVAMGHSLANAPAPQVTAQLTLAQKTAAPGAKVKGVVKVIFPEGLHGYQNPPTKEYMIPVGVKAKAKGFKLVSVTYPKGVARKSPGEQGDVMVYDGEVLIPIVVQMPTKPGTVTIKLIVEWQSCTEMDCFPPEEVTVTGQVVVAKPVKKAK